MLPLFLSHHFMLFLKRRMNYCSRTRLRNVLLGAILLLMCEYLGVFRHMMETDYETKFSYPLDVNIEELTWPLKQGQKPTVPFINEYSYRYKIKSANKCKTADDDDFEDVVLLFVIKSAIPNADKRAVIRKTWGWERRFSDVKIRRVFVLGESGSGDPTVQDQIDQEQVKFQDLVQADFIDNYYNNTIKTMMGFKWIVHYCPRAQYIMFSDDDMYISTKNLLKFVRNPYNIPLGFERRRLLGVGTLSKRNSGATSAHRNHQNNRITPRFSSPSIFSEISSYFTDFPTRRLLERRRTKIYDGRVFAGYLFDTSPMRNKFSKWYISLEEYPFSAYPPYIAAGAYVLSNIALLDLYYTSLYTKHFRFDDVYLGIVAKKAGIEPIHNENFHFWRKSYTRSGYADVIASHGFSDPKELYKVWEEQRSLGHA